MNRGPDAFDWNIKLPSMHQFEWVKCGCWQIERIKIYSFSHINSVHTQQNSVLCSAANTPTPTPAKLYRGKLSCELPIMGWLYICLCGSLPNIFFFRYLHVMTGFSPHYQIAIKYHYLSTCFVHSGGNENYMHKNVLSTHQESNWSCVCVCVWVWVSIEICNQSMSICRYTRRAREWKEKMSERME